MQQHEGFTNELINETSPYLLEHAHNPVNWYPWGEKALEKAKLENKPLIISIGYAACHWCHVMEKESFSDTSVARLMNENFICIKVDREERPDVDQVYMDACQMVTGSGGWPLNAFALPDGKPFYAGTYFPKKQWVQLLEQLDRAYREEYEKVSQQAENITQGIRRMDLMNLPKEDTADLDPDSFDGLLSHWESNIDFKLGGFNRAPKFPLPSAWNFLLEFNYLTRDETSLQAVRLTLDEMAKGGIYDQIGGGFARYSTDAYWRVPHFEKMLYDNAQLISLYSKAYQSQDDPEYKFIIESTLDFIARELTDSNGGFYSSLNADSEGEEGKYYVWTFEELKEALSDEDLALIEDHYNITERGNWEHGKNILYRTSTINQLEDNQKGLSWERISKINETLLAVREKRIRPSTDDKILTSWNAMMISGYLDAYLALGRQEYLEIAIRESNFLKQHVLTERKRLFHNYKNGKASIDGFLEDYAFLIKAYIDLYQVTFDQQWLDLSNELSRVAIEEFFDDSSGLFFFTARSGEQLVARKIEIPDNVIPSANSVMANNLFILGHLYFNEDYLKMSRKMLTLQIPSIRQGGAYFSNWASLWGKFGKDYYEVAITGKDATESLLEMRSAYLPNAVFLGGTTESLPLLESKVIEGQTTIYVCKGRVCDLPTTEVKKALEQIKN